MTHRLRLVVRNPLTHSPYPQRNIQWELENCIWIPLYEMWELSGNEAISDAFKDIQPFFADALYSIQKFICGMDWDHKSRELMEETQYHFTVQDVLELIRTRIQALRPIQLRNSVDSTIAVWSIRTCQLHVVRVTFVTNWYWMQL